MVHLPLLRNTQPNSLYRLLSSAMTTRRIFRFFCSAHPNSSKFSEEELQAIRVLKQKAEQPLSKAAQNVMKNRQWARAPVIEVSGKVPPRYQMTKKGKKFVDPDDVERSTVKIRWAEMANRDVDILLNEEETFYSVEVKAVLYGIIQAISFGEKNVRLKNTNEVVVKVANGKYAASKEVTRYLLIRKVLTSSKENHENQLRAVLEKHEKGIRRISKEQLTESEFFEKHRNSIEMLKNYS